MRAGRLASLPSTILSSAMMKVSVTARDFGNVMLKESYNNPNSSWMLGLVFGSLAIKVREGLGFVGAEVEDGPTSSPRA